MTVCAPSGELLSISLNVTNTGSLRISSLQLEAEAFVTSGLVCTLDSATFVFGTTGSVLQPGDTVQCSKEHNVTTEDIETSFRDLNATVTGVATGQPSLSVTKTQFVSSAPRPGLVVEMVQEECDKPLQPGRLLVLLWYCWGPCTTVPPLETHGQGLALQNMRSECWHAVRQGMRT